MFRDADYDAIKARIDKYFHKWRPILNLDRWEIQVSFCRESVLKVNGEYSVDCLAHASCRWEYMHATITYGLIPLSEKTDDELELVIVHEFCHLLVSEMREWCQTTRLTDDSSASSMKHEERVVTQMADSFVRAWYAGIDSTKASTDKS